MAYQVLRWCWTLHNYQSLDPPGDLIENAAYICFAEELGGQAEAPHLQGYLRLHRPRTLGGVVRLFGLWGGGVHLEQARGSEAQGVLYCRGPYAKDGKEKPVNEFFYEWGTLTGPGGSSDKWPAALALAKSARYSDVDPQIQITQFVNLRKLYAEVKPSPSALPAPCGLWVSGSSGTGKSQLARSFGAWYDKEPSRFWDLYANQGVVVVDDIDPKTCKDLDRYLKLWADRYPFQAEVKGGTLGLIRPTMLIVTSQFALGECVVDPRTVEALQRRFREVQCWRTPEGEFKNDLLPTPPPPSPIGPGTPVTYPEAGWGEYGM